MAAPCSSLGAAPARLACSRSAFLAPNAHLRRSITATRLSRRAPRPSRVSAYRESEKIQDWRVQQMVDAAHTYFNEFLSKGRAELAESLFDEDVVHKDVVWDAAHPTAGIQGMKHYIADVKAAFPDFWATIDEFAVAGTNSILVTYEGSATGIGEWHHHKPSHTASAFSGINLLRFNDDRSRITEIQVYRSAFAEDKEELVERVSEGGFRELRLKRLV